MCWIGNVLFIMRFKSVDETLVCDHSNESFSCGTVYYAIKGGFC